ncbi:MAG: hypothetical protein JWN68_1456 [Nocardioides sp.]|uniref:DUF6113 family protein n=1 Tax=Nocardioides sp. TaxID=35761 RepID=UPI00262FE944|nr:hypothetical protein [Nocardioides sp.]MCW2833503.1 hypothetical protein [Nocardioides sp.]
MLLVRLALAVALLVLGASAALAATLVHQRWWGLVLGLAAAALATLALPGGSRRFAFMLGWFGAIAYAVLPRTEGDYLIAASGSGYTLIGGSFLLFLTALTTLPRPGSSRRSRGDDQGLLES